MSVCNKSLSLIHDFMVDKRTDLVSIRKTRTSFSKDVFIHSWTWHQHKGEGIIMKLVMEVFRIVVLGNSSMPFMEQESEAIGGFMATMALSEIIQGLKHKEYHILYLFCFMADVM